MLSRVWREARHLAADTRATAQIEYVLIAVLVAIGSLAALTAMAGSVVGIWSGLEDDVVASVSGSDEEDRAENGRRNLGNFRNEQNRGRGKDKRKDKKPGG